MLNFNSPQKHDTTCLRSLASCALAMVGLAQSSACDLCSIYSAEEAQREFQRGPITGVGMQFTHFGTLQTDGHTIPRHGAHIDSIMSQPFVGYAINSRISVQFNLPVIYRQYGSDEGGNHDVSGLGDVSLTGTYKLYEKKNQDFSLIWRAMGGGKFPTGATGHLNPNEPDFAEGIGGHDLTLGSGSYDGIVGTSLYLRHGKWFGAGNVQYAIRTKGDFGYRFSNDLMWSAGLGYFIWLGENHTLSIQAAVCGEDKGKDTLGGAAVDDSAITAVYAGPQVNFTWGQRFTAQIGADLPAYIHGSATQLVPDYRIRAGLAYHF